jgi:uncharacterized Ntn-hydrolase superfamily protein
MPVAQARPPRPTNRASIAAYLATFSIVGRCPQTGMLGAVSVTGRPFVGTLIPQLSPGVAVAASQAMVNPLLSFRVFDRIRTGLPVESALQAEVANDPGGHLRQVIVVDHSGASAAHTGASAIKWAGHYVGNGFAAAGNMLTSARALDTLVQGFSTNPEAELAERLVAAVESVDRSGEGDVRGKRSATLLIWGPERYPFVDLRVDDDSEPVVELRRLFELWKFTQRPYQVLMPTNANLAGVVDEAMIRSVREQLLSRPDEGR